ncbi:hypothetical protein [Corynebacterium sp.]|uniref:hypothetical protein n=1 Tax=Corynebacterium sp. TaxID=1720 RepID=UPI0025BCEB85|nr:hypothetical protein [Corynebacterium sp.]
MEPDQFSTRSAHESRVSAPLSAAVSFIFLYGAVSLSASSLRADILVVGSIASAVLVTILEFITAKKSRISVLLGFALVAGAAVVAGLS